MAHKMLNAGQTINISKMIDEEMHRTDAAMMTTMNRNSSDAMTEWAMNRANDTVSVMISKLNGNSNTISLTPDEPSER